MHLALSSLIASYPGVLKNSGIALSVIADDRVELPRCVCDDQRARACSNSPRRKRRVAGQQDSD